MGFEEQFESITGIIVGTTNGRMRRRKTGKDPVSLRRARILLLRTRYGVNKN